MTTWVNTIRQIADGEALNATNLNKAANDANQNATYCKENLPTWFAARVTAGAAQGTPFPAGWGVSPVGEGIYQITHPSTGLNAKLVPVVQADLKADGNKMLANVTDISATGFKVYISTHGSGTLTSSPFSFMAIATL